MTSRVGTARHAVAGALGLVLLGAAGASLFVWSGWYDIAAMHPHQPIVHTILSLVQRRSIEYHAREIRVPKLENPNQVRRGLQLYRQHCVVCHGAPGEGRGQAGIGLNPSPPPLEQAIEHWSEAEIYWTTAFGLKMAGMPSFALSRTPDEIWAMVAFIRQMNRLSPDDYRRMVKAVEGSEKTGEIRWLGETRAEAVTRASGDPARGKELLQEFGCPSCHVIPGIRGPGGNVGPPLTRWAERQFISGRLVNTPAALTTWIMNPKVIEPGTAMPALGASVEQAQHMAAYLYTLGRLRW